LQGERVAIVGPNGAGKSTMAKLLARLYDIQSGEIRFADSDVRALTLASLRTCVCYLPAQPILFHRSIAENLRVGNPDSTYADVEAVLRVVGLTKYLDTGPLVQMIEPGASNLSNGERQRFVIARALLHKPRILILDETTSSLDPASEEAMLRAINHALPDSTLLVVSHRMHSISWMGRILVVEKGQIVGDGTHSSLFGTNACYTEFRTSTATLD
jgi:ABC-type multidrug transport system fused ATPase/permease subunit